jgi:hypothetical protein
MSWRRVAAERTAPGTETAMAATKATVPNRAAMPTAGVTSAVLGPKRHREKKEERRDQRQATHNAQL